MSTDHITWIRVSRASELLGVSEDTVRRMVAAGRLEATGDPEALATASTGRGRPPALLVSLQSVVEALAEQDLVATRALSSDQAGEVLAKVPELEIELARARAELTNFRDAALTSVREELSRLRAELSNVREVALQAMVRDEALDKAERARLESERSRIDADLARLDADRARREQLRVFLMPDFASEY